jgi:hypothetical protein
MNFQIRGFLSTSLLFPTHSNIPSKFSEPSTHLSSDIQVPPAGHGLINPHQNDQGRKGPCFFQRLIALK